jgi:hypothetical protein
LIDESHRTRLSQEEVKMRRSFLAICLISVVLITILVPSCESPEEGATIIVKATLCGAPWEGAVNCTITDPEGEVFSLSGGAPIGITLEEVRSGFYTAEFLDGGPPAAIFTNIVPEESQAVMSGDTVIFTLNFEKKQDASIEFKTWTMDGVPIEQWGGTWDYIDGSYYVSVEEWSHIIDVHYQERVDGCDGGMVTVNETSALQIHWLDAMGEYMYPQFHVANNWCAVVKEPEPEKLSQSTSFNGEPVEQCTYLDWPQPGICENVTLDVETSWLLERPIDYVKTTNWLHIGECGPQTSCCTLFELLVDAAPGSGYIFEMVSCTEVKLMGDSDANPDNNYACSPSLILYYEPSG